MQSKLPLLPSGPGGVRKSTFHGPWRNLPETYAAKPEGGKKKTQHNLVSLLPRES